MFEPDSRVRIWPRRDIGLARIDGVVIEDGPLGIVVSYEHGGESAVARIPHDAIARIEDVDATEALQAQSTASRKDARAARNAEVRRIAAETGQAPIRVALFGEVA